MTRGPEGPGEPAPGREPPISQRKDEHLTIAARADIVHHAGTGLERLRLRHRALPGRDLDAVDLSVTFLGRRLGAPLIVSAMTGGTARARLVNARLAAAASAFGLAMGLGSGRALLEHPELVDTYRLPDRPPLVFANLGAVQFRRGVTPADAERLVDLLDADGLMLHLNALQEAIQPAGDTVFAGLEAAIGAVVARLAPRPVVVKEIGFGLAPEDVAALVPLGVAALDIAAAGGTNWALIEGRRSGSPDDAAVAEAFAAWGWPTAVALREAVRIAGPAGVPIIASGGIRDGVEVAIALALGADLIGLARPFLLAALEDRTEAYAATLVRQLRVAVWLAGAAGPRELGPTNLVEL